MVNLSGRLQRLNRAIETARPGPRRLGNPARPHPRPHRRKQPRLHLIEDVFKATRRSRPRLQRPHPLENRPLRARQSPTPATRSRCSKTNAPARPRARSTADRPFRTSSATHAGPRHPDPHHPGENRRAHLLRGAAARSHLGLFRAPLLRRHPGPGRPEPRRHSAHALRLQEGLPLLRPDPADGRRPETVPQGGLHARPRAQGVLLAGARAHRRPGAHHRLRDSLRLVDHALRPHRETRHRRPRHRPAVRFRGLLAHRLRHHPRRLVVELEVPVHRRRPLHRADDFLRNRARPLDHPGPALLRRPQPRQHRPTAGRQRLAAAALLDKTATSACPTSRPRCSGSPPSSPSSSSPSRSSRKPTACPSTFPSAKPNSSAAITPSIPR